MKTGRKPLVPERRQARAVMPGIFAGLLGAFLGLSLLKFGNPVIMEKWVTPPSDLYEGLSLAYRLGLRAPGCRQPGWVVLFPPSVWRSAAVADFAPRRLVSLGIPCGKTIRRTTAQSRDGEAFRRLCRLFLSGLLLIESGKESAPVLAGVVLWISRGTDGWPGATLRRIRGVAAVFFPLRLPSYDGAASAGISEKDLQQPHLLHIVLPQCARGRLAAAAPGHIRIAFGYKADDHPG